LSSERRTRERLGGRRIFGEALPDGPWESARESASHCDVFFCIGTSSLVQPAASLTDIAIDAGATTIQVNPNPTDIDDSVTFSLRGAAGTVLPHFVADTWSAFLDIAPPFQKGIQRLGQNATPLLSTIKPQQQRHQRPSRHNQYYRRIWREIP